MYDIPSAKSGDVTIGNKAVSGGFAKAYYVVKNGRVREIRKAKYNKTQFRELFSDCHNMLQTFT